jgi:hypothetical protein
MSPSDGMFDHGTLGRPNGASMSGWGCTDHGWPGALAHRFFLTVPVRRTLPLSPGSMRPV